MLKQHTDELRKYGFYLLCDPGTTPGLFHHQLSRANPGDPELVLCYHYPHPQLNTEL